MSDHATLEMLLPGVPPVLARLTRRERVESARWHAATVAREWGRFRYHVAMSRRGRDMVMRRRHLRTAESFLDRVSGSAALLALHHHQLGRLDRAAVYLAEGAFKHRQGLRVARLLLAHDARAVLRGLRKAVGR